MNEQINKDRELLANSQNRVNYLVGIIIGFFTTENFVAPDDQEPLDTYVQKLLAAQERLIKEEYRKKLQKIIDCDDDCIKGYQCFYDHHKLKKELNQIINHD